MERVRQDWTKAWAKVKVDYNRSVYDVFLRPNSREFLKILGRYIKKDQLVLEAGCGYGHKCLLFSRYYKANVVGVDIVSYPLETLMNYLRLIQDFRIFVCCGDVTKLPFRDHVFDVITSFGVVEHFRNEYEVILALNEARRTLKVGGYLILTIPNFAATFRNKLVMALTKGRFGMYHRPYTVSLLVNLLKMVKGLQIVEVGFMSFGFRSLILSIAKSPSVEKVIYFLYHAMWRILNCMLKTIGEDYQNPIYIIARRIR